MSNGGVKLKFSYTPFAFFKTEISCTERYIVYTMLNSKYHLKKTANSCIGTVNFISQ